MEAGEPTRDESIPTGNLDQSKISVVEGRTGEDASGPVLLLRPDVATVRLKPDESRRCLLLCRPESMWKELVSMVLTFHPPVKELQAIRTSQLLGEELSLKFEEPEDIEEDEYPIETVMQATE